MTKKAFIVPHDFTPIAENALETAIVTAKPFGATIHLLHVVSKDTQIEESLQKLEEIAAKHSGDGVEILPSVRIGNIFEDISEFAAEHQAELIIMGTHGPHGWQYITGSNALRVVMSSQVPFIIVQGKAVRPTGFDSIVVPMDLHKETKQKLSYVATLAKYFNSKVHVVTPDESDEFLRNQVQSNLLFAEAFFHDRDIEMTTAIIPSSGFDKEVVKYAAMVNADLIAIMNLNKNAFLSAITTNYEQYIITNDALIPTMIVNPIESEFTGTSMFTM
ncbi:MAG: hypothetical protein RL264_2349 [Bacteroidota bacterium]|jgi:nucleotide-binding universal stress UspA family protein